MVPDSAICLPKIPYLCFPLGNIAERREIYGKTEKTIYGHMLTAIAGMEIAEGNSLTEQIRIDERRGKTLRLIASLERQMAVAKQPRRKRELFGQLRKLKSLLDPNDGHMDIPEADADDEIPDA